MTSHSHFPDDAFSGHVHTHMFANGESPEKRAQWLREVLEICKASDTECFVRSVEKNGQHGYEFGFSDVTHYAAFHLNVFGEMEGKGNHRHLHSCETAEDRDVFRQAAEMHLRALGIKYTLEERGNALEFKFDKFSDRMTFVALIENGTLDASARGLAQVQAVRKAMGWVVPAPVGLAQKALQKFMPG